MDIQTEGKMAWTKEDYKKYRERPEVKARQKAWREENKERLKAYKKRPEVREKKNAADRKLYHKKRKDPEFCEKERLRLREFRINNPKKVKFSKNKYNSSKKGKKNVTYHNHRRLALIKKRKTDLTNKKVKEIFNRDKVCVYCSSDKKLELDHIIPLKAGGSCMSNNFVVACASCNRSKSGKDVFSWCKSQGIQVPKIIKSLIP